MLAEGLRTWFNEVNVAPSVNDFLYWVEKRELHLDMDCFKTPYYEKVKKIISLVHTYHEACDVVDYMSKVGVATKAFNQIIAEYKVFGEHSLYAAVNIANLFGMEYGKYLSAHEQREYHVHDLGVNLPLVAPNSEQGLKGWLLKYAPTINLADAMLVARRWRFFTAEEKELAKRSTKKALEVARSYTYENIESKVFAQEAAKWGDGAK